MAGTDYFRCSHCRGFYDVELGACKYCGYTTVVGDAAGVGRRFAGREICRAIQIAEYEQLPAEAMADCFKPPREELTELCGCLHCGPGGPAFEAVEMRWMANEQMWACPCTTCGGRGYTFDIHPLTPRWECAECGHKWAPPEGNEKQSNCKCPKCGSTLANGWFQDEYSEDELEAMSDAEYLENFGKSREQEEREYQEFNARFEKEQEERRLAGKPPFDGGNWSDDAGADLFKPVEGPVEDFAAYDPEARKGEEGAGGAGDFRGEPKLRDDIDFPHDPPPPAPPLKEGDIPF